MFNAASHENSLLTFKAVLAVSMMRMHSHTESETQIFVRLAIYQLSWFLVYLN